MNKRIGQFAIPNQLLHQNPEIAGEIMNGAVVLIAERNPEFTKYVALHSDFSEIVDGEEPPAYEFTRGKWVKI